MQSNKVRPYSILQMTVRKVSMYAQAYKFRLGTVEGLVHNNQALHI